MGNGKQAQPSLGQKVHVFAENHMGQQVGRGECYDLPYHALVNAGAKSAPDYGKITDHANYVWGKEVNLLKAQPGDILQFRDHKIIIVTTIKTKRTYRDGSGQEEEEIQKRSYRRGHHCAIVSSNDSKGVFTIFEQHVRPPGQKHVSNKVQRNKIYVAGMTKKHPKEVRMEGRTRVEVETTTVIKVKGKIWVYRPEPK
jgi:hypothetical protein